MAPRRYRRRLTVLRPHELSHDEILTLIDDFAHCAQLAREAGYDGVEVMGSEGYLINEFLAARTNQRDDQWGGDYARRMRFAIEVVKAVHQRAGHDFIIIYRLSMLDLVNDGSTLAEVTELAKAIEAAGATIINTGIGWHEARIPTIATPVPRGAFSWSHPQTERRGVDPVDHHQPHQRSAGRGGIFSLAGDADMVSMARPFLADAEFMSKAQRDRAGEINTCIGCNQACLDRIFAGKVTSCLVNPRACHETLMPVLPANAPKRLAVVGAGPAGLAFAVNAAALAVITSRCSMRSRRSAASLISPNRSPGKEEFHETLRYYRTMLDLHGVDLRLNTRVTADDLLTFDETILATGIAPRLPAIDGIDHPKVLSYLDVLRDKTPVGEKVAIIGCGGIGFDTAMYLSQSGAATSQDIGEVLPRMGYRYQPANGGRAAS